MADGALAAVGRHDELLRTCEAYRVLCRTQLQAVEQPTA
jgi:ABC-type multidrug transport system fused ATPase/permease subunit